MTTHDVISPIDESVFTRIRLASGRDIDQALERATRAARDWKRTSLGERAAICERMVDWMLAHTADIAIELTQQMGRPVSQTPLEIRRGFQERARYMTAIAAEALADIDVGALPGFHRFIRREPLGSFSWWPRGITLTSRPSTQSFLQFSPATASS